MDGQNLGYDDNKGEGTCAYFYQEKGKILMLGFEACHQNSMTTIVFRNRDEKFLYKIKKHARKKYDMTTVEKWLF